MANTTRFDIIRDPRNPVDHLETGYEGATLDSGETIASCEIEDVDRAMKSLFDSDIGFVTTKVKGESGLFDISKPYVIFASGERFALAKKLRPPRDKNKVLILPAVSIRRTGISQTDQDAAGRGINQSSGPLVIKRRLDAKDRQYQNLVNKIGQNNAALSPMRIVTTPDKTVGNKEGAWLDPNLGDNIFEIISIPSPQFYTASYEVTFWTSYTEHMNYMIMTLFSSFLPQGRMFRLNTPQGYWFIAYVDNEFSGQENFEEFTEKERIVRYTFTVQVKAYLIGFAGPGAPVPVRRYLSAPQLDFQIYVAPDQVVAAVAVEGDPNPVSDVFALTNFTEDPVTAQTTTTDQKYRVKKQVLDPKTGNPSGQTKYVKIVERNQKSGETSYTTSGVTSLDDFLLTIKE